jgi:hypothetical protein
MLFNKRYRKCFPSDFHELTKTIITAIFGKSCRYCELNLHVSPKTFFFFFFLLQAPTKVPYDPSLAEEKLQIGAMPEFSSKMNQEKNTLIRSRSATSLCSSYSSMTY